MIYIGLLLLLLLIIVPFVRKWAKGKHDYAEAKQTVMEAKDHYAFLIDKDFRVKETNFYELNKDLDDGQPNVLGNVLHCSTGCDSGLCGTGIACQVCPVRIILTNSFKQKRDFNNVTAIMRLYDAKREVKDVDVSVNGRFVYLGYVPYMLVDIVASK